ncbi:MAG: pyridoxal phosphate-dependent decarboxylase family protein, partial [Gemmatimonadota bacterium]
SGPGILGEMLAAALNVNAMLWRTGPAATELEEVTLDWLRRMLGLPEGLDGTINDTASASTLYALAAARESASDLRVRDEGLAGRAEVPPLRVYCSEEAHSSVDKAVVTLGLGLSGVRRIPTDDAFRMDAAALARAVGEDRAAGARPLAVVATVGTTSTTSIDPVAAIADVCEREGLWLHVDGAYGGIAAAVPELRHVLDGCERADSIVVNPHKWLFTPIDCSALYTRRPALLRRAFSIVPEYLRTDEGDEGAVRNLMDYGISLGRRFRALKLWFVLRRFGAAGIADRLRGHMRLARRFADRIDEADDWERLAPVPFSTVVFRHRPAGGVVEPAASGSSGEAADEGRGTASRRAAGDTADGAADSAGPAARDAAALDAHNERLLARVNASGEVFLSHTRVGGRYALRLAVGNLRTTASHVDRAWELLREAAGE